MKVYVGNYTYCEILGGLENPVKSDFCVFHRRWDALKWMRGRFRSLINISDIVYAKYDDEAMQAKIAGEQHIIGISVKECELEEDKT